MKKTRDYLGECVMQLLNGSKVIQCNVSNQLRFHGDESLHDTQKICSPRCVSVLGAKGKFSLAGGEGRGRPEEEIFQAERRPTAVLPLTDEEIYY